MKNTFYLILLFICSLQSCKKESQITIKTGDFIFQDLDCGAMCDAIENATLNKVGIPISHVGIAIVENNEIFVIEAYGSVLKTPLKGFLNRTNGVEYIGRLKKEYQQFIPISMEKVKKQLGKPYDEVFELYNDAFYCSELMYEFFLDKNNKPLFSKVPMTFKNNITNSFDDVWIEHFEKMNTPIPEGKPGCNPADYFESDKITILGEM